jgi:hypothetical protein
VQRQFVLVFQDADPRSEHGAAVSWFGSGDIGVGGVFDRIGERLVLCGWPQRKLLFGDCGVSCMVLAEEGISDS